MNRSALISPCGTYRYLLERAWVPDFPVLTFVMLNPSTADGDQDDPTIRKCIGFARRHGCGAIRVVNLFAYRATDWRHLPKLASAGVDIVGPDNAATVRAHVLERDQKAVVCAWGSPAFAQVQGDAMTRRLVARLAPGLVQAFGQGWRKTGGPWHPLYLRYDLPLAPWSGRRLS